MRYEDISSIPYKGDLYPFQLKLQRCQQASGCSTISLIPMQHVSCINKTQMIKLDMLQLTKLQLVVAYVKQQTDLISGSQSP